MRTRNLNLVFALTSIALLLTFSLMVWADYNREWKKHQLAFNKLDVKVTEEQRAAAAGKVDAAKVKALEAQVAEGEKEAAARTEDLRKARAELKRLERDLVPGGPGLPLHQGPHRRGPLRLRGGRAQGREESAAARKKKLDELEAQWNQYRLDREKVEADQAVAKASITAIEGTEQTAQKALEELYIERTRLDSRLAAIEPGLVSTVRNLPILDMASTRR